MGGEKLTGLLQESLASATRAGTTKPSDFSKVIANTTVQEKVATFQTDARLSHQACERLVRLEKKRQLTLSQSYELISKRTFIVHQPYAHAKEFKLAKRSCVA